MAAKRKTKPAARRRRSGAGWSPPQLEQHHLDLIGLALVAFAAFLAFVLYMGAAGGRVGERDRGRPALPARRRRLPRPARAVCGGGADRAAPAGSRGRPLPRRRHLPAARDHARAGRRVAGARARRIARTSRCSTATYVSDRGGVVGELLFEGARSLFSDFGAHILFLFLMTGGTLLLTGASIAGVVSAMGRQVATTTQRVRRQAERTAVLARDAGPTAPPEPPGVEPVVHATHVEAPALDAESRFPDLFGGRGRDVRRQTSEASEEPEPPPRRTRRWSRRPMPDPDAPAGPAAAYADGERPHRGDRGRRRRLHASQAPVPEALQRQAEGQGRRRTTAWARSWWRRSGTSGSRRRWWAA